MRSEQEMYDLILGFAKENPLIRAVYLNGSRANPKAPRDRFQDFDIVYAVKEVAPFLKDKSWISRFGKMAVMQEPDDSVLFPSSNDPNQRYAFLMQFADGNRIDLTFLRADLAPKACQEDSLTVILLDKDGILPKIPDSSDRDYWVKKPCQEEFWACCNEFWWVSPYAAKGLYRHETLYALDCLNSYIRPMLLKMLCWQAGIAGDFQISAGKSGKYLDRYLPKETYGSFLKTYPAAEEQAIWDALHETMNLFSKTARLVGEHFGFSYRTEEEEGVRNLLRLSTAG